MDDTYVSEPSLPGDLPTVEAVEPEPMIDVTVTLHLPAVLVLPVQTLPDQSSLPATGFVWQKYLDFRQLGEWGVRVEWQYADQTPMDAQTALERIAALELAAQVAHEGKSDNAN